MLSKLPSYEILVILLV